jgi:hypothetical protein
MDSSLVHAIFRLLKKENVRKKEKSIFYFLFLKEQSETGALTSPVLPVLLFLALPRT